MTENIEQDHACGCGHDFQSKFIVSIVWDNDLQSLQQAIEDGQDVNEVIDSNGGRLLHHAATMGHLSIAQYLVERGALAQALRM